MNLPQEVPLPSGAKLHLQMAPFKSGVRLMKAVAAELKVVGIDAELDPRAMLAKNPDVPIDLLKNVLCQALTSEPLEAAMWECAGRSSYVLADADKGVAVTAKCFEDEEARGDYLLAAWEVIRFNLTPFFSGLRSQFLTGANPTTGSQKSE